MNIRPITPRGISSGHTYAPAVQITGLERLLFISGQIPETAEGRVPGDFASQARLVWRNIMTTLTAADLVKENLVKITVYLADRCYRGENADIRDEYLGEHQVALTVLIAGIFDSKWLLEIEAVAAA